MADEQRPFPSVKDLVAQCLERLEGEGSAALNALFAAHPDHAAALRSRLAALVAAGLVDVELGVEFGVEFGGDVAGDTRADASPPERLAGFQLLRRLGGGGMGVVHLARQFEPEREVALKLVRPELLFFDGARRRFAREVQAVARLSHPGIVPVYAAGEDQGVPYLAMERVAGVSLAQVLDELAGRAPEHMLGADLSRATVAALRRRGEHGVASAADGRGSDSRSGESWARTVTRLGVTVADALQHAHERGVLHRDVKPSNLMITPAGRVLLVDFGLALAEGDARLTTSGSPLGSLAYMAPEQVRGARQVDARTDVYGLGVTLYELLSLRPPYPTASHELLRQRILEGRPEPLRTINPAVSLELATVVLTAMDPEPGRRYASAAALRDDLLAVLERRPIDARPPGPLLRLRRAVQRRPALAAVVALGGLLLVGAPLLWAGAQREANRELAAALEREQALVESERLAGQATQAALARAEEHLADAQRAVEALSDVARSELEFVVGQGPVRERLLREALAFSERIAAREGDTPVLAEVAARAAFRVGLMRMDLGEHADAEPSLRDAAARAQRLLDVDPEHLGGLELLARATSELARLADLASRPDEGRRLRGEALGLLERWSTSSADPAARLALAQVHFGVAVAATDRGRLDEALQASRQAAAACELLLEAQAHDVEARELLALALSVEGQVQHQLGRDDRALPPLERARALQQGLRAERPADVFVVHGLAMTELFSGRCLESLGRRDDAVASLERALARFDWLAERAPDTPMMRAPRATAHTALASVQAARGDPGAAASHYGAALAVLEHELARPDPLLRNHGDRGLVLLALGILLRDHGQPAEAAQVLDDAIESQRRALAADPSHATWRSGLRNQLWTRALVALKLGRAAACADDARALHEHVGAEQDGRRIALGLLARAAGATADAAARRAWTEQCFAWLEALVADGWDDPRQLEDTPALASLRGDPRYAALLERLRRAAP